MGRGPGHHLARVVHQHGIGKARRGHRQVHAVPGHGRADWLYGLHGAHVAGLSHSVDSEELHDPLLQEPWVAAAVSLHANTVAPVRLVLWDRDPDDQAAQEITSGPLRDLFDWIGPDLTPAKLRKADAIHMDLSGSVLAAGGRERAAGAHGGLYADALVQLPYQLIPKMPRSRSKIDKRVGPGVVSRMFEPLRTWIL